MSRPRDLDPGVTCSLVRNHGSEYRRVLAHGRADPRLLERIGTTHVIGAEVIHAVRAELAQKLADVVYRRTDLGTGELPPPEALRTCAELMAAELGWTTERVESELVEVRAAFPRPIPEVAPHRAAWTPAAAAAPLAGTPL